VTKLPLSEFIAKLYVKRFGKTAPASVRTSAVAKKEAKKLHKAAASADASDHGPNTSGGTDEMIE
jgi:hypothetical protein